MQKNLLTLGLIGLVLALLIGLNLVFISEPRGEETETNGDRSSYKGSPYGTLAYYLLLEETGRTVTRWERPFTELEEAGIGTLVVAVPHEEHQPTEEEILALEAWVLAGGRLLVFDRVIALDFTAFGVSTGPPIDADVMPAAPTMLTRGVDRLDVTEYATPIVDSTGESAIHFASEDGPVVIDRQYGDGHIAFVTEPYVIQNNGIARGRNLALALNLMEAYGDPGTIAFDEYHHGYGAALGGSSGGLRGYIRGTPVPWIILQLAILGAAAAFTVGRRYGRPVPLATERRTSALEFVGSMASIQMLAKASDLAIENIGSSFRIRLCRYAGVPSDAPAATIARAAASRSRVEESELLDVLERCEAALVTKPSRTQLLELVQKLRDLEQRLKL